MKRINLNSPKAVVFAALLIFAAFLILHSGKASAEKNAGAALSEKQSAESQVFSEFDDWIKRFLDGNFSNKRKFFSSGEKLAFKRRELFKELIKTNPQAAIEKAVSEDVQARLPVSITRFLERNISAGGDFNVYAVDDFDSAASINQPLEREVIIENIRYKAFVYGRKASMTTKLNVPLRGVALDDSMAVDENTVRKIEPSEYKSRKVDTSKIAENGIAADAGGKLIYFSGRADFDKYVADLENWESKIGPDKSSARLSPWTTGDKTMLFIRVDYPDRPGEPIDRFGQILTESAAQNIINGQVNDFYYANSYKKTTLRATVTPVVRMPLPQTAYPRDNLFALVTDARNAALAAGFDTNEYNLDVVAYSYTPLHAFSGISPIGNKGALFNGSFTFKTVTHEIGHEYGLGHANLWRTFDGTTTGNGENIEYGDDFDMMGRGNTQETHFNASYKRTLDWLTEENVKTVTQNGVYRVFAFDINTPNPQGIRALKIKKDDVKNYWIDFRQLLTGLPNLMDGALIHWDYPFNFWRQTQILDMQPDTQSLTDASILIGQTFQDEASGIKIKVLGKGGTTPESLDIQVEFNYSIRNGAQFDFDGDNKTDISIFRPSAGEWWYYRSSDGGNYAAQFGNSSDKLTPGDFTGDGRADIAVFRPSTGEW
ncbi:MAG: FG-GAP-like repeat-containing protein, partial [Pyrinomonadaceae bacterium]